MFGKIALLILVLGGLAAAMLVDRQQRLDLAAAMQRTHARLRQHEQAIWRLRADLAYRTRPHEIRTSIERLNVRMVPIPDRLQRPRTESPPASLAAGPGASPSPAVGRKPLGADAATGESRSESEYGG